MSVLVGYKDSYCSVNIEVITVSISVIVNTDMLFI